MLKYMYLAVNFQTSVSMAAFCVASIAVPFPYLLTMVSNKKAYSYRKGNARKRCMCEGPLRINLSSPRNFWYEYS